MSVSFRVEWTDAARHDLEEIADYILRESRSAALRLIERVEQQATTLETMPRRGRVPPELIRFRVHLYHELLVAPYRLIYRVDADVVTVLAVFDGRRDLEEVLIGRLLSL